MEKITYQGKIIEVVEKEVNINGKTKVFESARRSPGTRLIVVEGDNILLTKEFRQEIEGYDYRLPGGKVFDTLSEYNLALEGNIDIAESAKLAAIKEAREEVGIEVKNISFIHRSICGATVTWDLFYFLVDKFTRSGQHLEEGEDITVESFSKDEVRKVCLDGRMSEERSALVLLRYLDGHFK